MLVGDQARLWHAAREAARVGVVDPETSAVEAAAEDSGLTPLEVLVSPDPAFRIQGEPLTVSLSHRPGGHVPLVGELFDHVQLHATATMRIEQP